MQGDLPVSQIDSAAFAARHIGPSEDDQRAMLATLGYPSLDELLTAALPAYAPHAIAAQASLLASLLRSTSRVTSLERELDTLSGQLADTYEELSLIYQISGGMKVNRQADDFFRQTCSDVLDVMALRAVGVSLDPVRFPHQPPIFYGPLAPTDESHGGPERSAGPRLPAELTTRLAHELLALVAERKAPVLINDLANDPHLAFLAPHARRLLAVPMLRQDQLLGCLIAVDKDDDEDFDSVDSKLLNSIGNECAIYLENANLFDDVHGLMMGLLHSLTAAVDAKDAYTCGHSQRVALLSRELAKQLNLPANDVERVYMAGLLHDVGKIGVPEAVLQKAGKLTDEEFDLIKKHPEIGAKILGDIKQLRDVLPGVLHHHERYDGRGYPARLAGPTIPILGRIICLADSFDAMTSSRTYRKGMPLEVALTEIRRAAGTQFDPTLADAFLSIPMDQFRAVLKDHQELSRQLINTTHPHRHPAA